MIKCALRSIITFGWFLFLFTGLLSFSTQAYAQENGSAASSPGTAVGAAKIPAHIEQIMDGANSPRGAVERVTIVKQSGGRVSWSPVGDRIVFDQKGSDGYYDLYLMRPDGSDESCLTCDTGGVLSDGHKGTAEWHPSGKYIVFQSQKRQYMGTWGLNRAADPGNGRNSDLWVIDVASRKLFQLTRTVDTDDTGVLHPHFSHDGKQLTWSEMYARPKAGKRGQQVGHFLLKVADFDAQAGIPRLANVRDFEPGGPTLYENHGLSPDGRKLLFTGLFEMKGLLDFFKAANIYHYDIQADRIEKLAWEGYNEHAHYFPSGEKIIWMTSAGNANRGTDYWSMNPDGTQKRRLTDFNNRQNPGFRRKMIIASDASFNPDGTKLMAFLQNGLSYDGPMVLIEFNPEKLFRTDDHKNHDVLAQQSEGRSIGAKETDITNPGSADTATPVNRQTGGRHWREVWKTLTPEQKQFIKRQQEKWFRLSGPEKNAAIEDALRKWHLLSEADRAWWTQKANQWRRLSAEERQARIQALQSRWNALTPEQKAWLEAKIKEWNALNSEEKAAKKREWEQFLEKINQGWESLTPEQKAWWQEQSAKWQALCPEERAAKRREWNEGFKKWKRYWENLPPEQKTKWKAAGARWRRNWESLSSDEKRQKREAFQRWLESLKRNGR